MAAGLAMMGIHRNVIHQKFGNFISMGAILVDAEVSLCSQSINHNPCLECKLCLAACPSEQSCLPSLTHCILVAAAI